MFQRCCPFPRNTSSHGTPSKFRGWKIVLRKYLTKYGIFMFRVEKSKIKTFMRANLRQTKDPSSIPTATIYFSFFSLTLSVLMRSILASGRLWGCSKSTIKCSKTWLSWFNFLTFIQPCSFVFGLAVFTAIRSFRCTPLQNGEDLVVSGRFAEYSRNRSISKTASRNSAVGWSMNL